MMKKISIVAIVFLVFILGYLARKSTQKTEHLPLIKNGEVWAVLTKEPSPESKSITRSRENAIVLAAKRVGPAVVSISVIQTRYYRTSPFFDDFFDEFFRELFPPRVYKKEISSLGSGFIINEKGYILTNGHVVHNAEKIKVTLPDGREFDATIVGEDEISDIAMLKIDGKDLPYTVLGNSDDLIIGEWAIAIGNPFGYILEDPQPSVTVGVISALNRSIKPGSKRAGIYKNMIQTDAAINPGNSGGPLINADGEVIGINTFIITTSRGSEGVGFAIPINSAKKVISELIKYGEKRKVWLGIDVQEITELLRKTLKLKSKDGVLVSDIEKQSPAFKSGIRTGDIIISINEKKIKNPGDYISVVSNIIVGEDVKISVKREEERIDFVLKAEGMPEYSSTGEVKLGLLVQNNAPTLKKKFGLAISNGVVVLDVKPESIGDRIGIEVGDVIVEINRKKIKNVEDFKRVADKIKKRRVSLKINRKGAKISFSYIW